MPLTPADLARFRDRLRARDAELRRAIHEALVHHDDKSYAEVAGQVLDAGESSVADLLADEKIIEIGKEVAEQAEVMAALARMTEGRYGVCTDCGDEVGIKRLEVTPTASRCIRCQTHFEKSHAGAHDRTPSL